jgi:N-acetylmuramoyl-L-alanine amidase
MKSAAHRLIFAAASAGVGTLAHLNPAAAVQFGQQEIDASKFVTIAAPAGQTGHQLLILEQLNSSRQCWSETGTGPTIVKPELLQFDYSGICNRSADSNGYSLRVGGEDLGLRYTIRVIRQNGEMKLVAVSNQDRSAAPIEIGKTSGITDGFAKLDLNPGWRLTRRVYNGQPTGHIYLTHNSDLNTLLAATPTRPTSPAPTAPPQATPPVTNQPVTNPPVASQPVSARPVVNPPQAIRPPATNSPAPSLPETLPNLPLPPQAAAPSPITPGAINPGATLPTVPVMQAPRPSANPGSAPAPSSVAASMGFNYRVVVPVKTAAEQARVRAAVPGSFRTTIDNEEVMQVGLFRQQADATTFQRSLSQQNLQARVLPVNTVAAPTPTQPAPTQPSRPTTPSPAPSTPTNSFNYRVVVPASTAAEQARVRSAVPDAFRTTIDGQMMMQVGLFRQESEATALQRSLSQRSLQARILPASYTTTAPTTPLPPNTTTPKPNSPQVPTERLVVMIDPGHGGRDPGAIGIGGLQEKQVVLSISQQVAAILERNGIQAMMTRQDDRELDLAPRVSAAQRANADLFVSIHANALSMSRPDVNGVETYYYDSGRSLAQSIQSSIIQSTGQVDRGVRQARFYVIKNTTMPAVLVEVGFVTGRDDAAKLRDPAFQTKMAEAIARGILNHVRR